MLSILNSTKHSSLLHLKHIPTRNHHKPAADKLKLFAKVCLLELPAQYLLTDHVSCSPQNKATLSAP